MKTIVKSKTFVADNGSSTAEYEKTLTEVLSNPRCTVKEKQVVFHKEACVTTEDDIFLEGVFKIYLEWYEYIEEEDKMDRISKIIKREEEM